MSSRRRVVRFNSDHGGISTHGGIAYPFLFIV